MAKFIKGNQLNAELERIFDEAEQQLIIVSPYIKLHARILDVLKSKKQNDKLRIVIIFGKNEDNIANSFRKNDFEFLKDFPNIEIRYESRLHAKYYANESSALLSSMNLYDYSQNNNIEFGILTKVTLFGELTGNFFSDTLDEEAFKYFEQVAINSECLYKRTPEYDESLMGLKRKYTESHTEDQLSELLNSSVQTQSPYKSIGTKKKKHGYCIRTGVEIPFNSEKPFCDKAYKSWLRYKDKSYQEKYCHYSGEESNGETSFSRPILRKNWHQAKSKIR
ncbi:phospholipase D family protein [Flagellimonas eckloniae]|uniref:Phospholipase D-like domain-containing protein n=1 Tax=Flagellimonas eckloniae TaxID=346185 RepID=A0A0Q0XMH3_9FLAO|nr:phospholipase D family protein [Allomuricauda eckloniae]KQC30226.1 hypothetical protein AAY42_10330 [Allomuricauda eckloniae]